jgi:hypothetical protein
MTQLHPSIGTSPRVRPFLDEGLYPALLVEDYGTDEEFQQDAEYLRSLGYEIKCKYSGTAQGLTLRVTYEHKR